MRYCTNCGNSVNNDAEKVCSRCGATLPNTNNAGNAVSQPSAGGYSNAANYTMNDIPQYSMKWYKFLIYFSLFASTVLFFVYGMCYASGYIYYLNDSSLGNWKFTADLVYGIFGKSLKTINIIYGIVLFGTAILALVTRFKLAKYKKDGPTCLYALYIISAVASVLYSVAIMAITKVEGVFDAQLVGELIGQIVVLALNYKYFTKRKSLFCN